MTVFISVVQYRLQEQCSETIFSSFGIVHNFKLVHVPPSITNKCLQYLFLSGQTNIFMLQIASQLPFYIDLMDYKRNTYKVLTSKIISPL